MYLHKLLLLAIENLTLRFMRTVFLVLTVAIGAGATMFLFAFYRGLDTAIKDNLLKGMPEKQLTVEPKGVAESYMSEQLTSMLTMGQSSVKAVGISVEDVEYFKNLPGVEHPVKVTPKPLLPIAIKWEVDFDRLTGVLAIGSLLSPKIISRGIGGQQLFFGLDYLEAAKEFLAATGRKLPLAEDEVPIFLDRKFLRGAKDFTQIKGFKPNNRERLMLRLANKLFFDEKATGVPLMIRLEREHPTKGLQPKYVPARIVGFNSNAPMHGFTIPGETLSEWHDWLNKYKRGADRTPLLFNSVVIKTQTTDDMLAAADAISRMDKLKVSGRLVTARRLTNLQKILPPATLLIGIILFFLAAGGIVVGLSLSVAEQTQRIGILRAVGSKQLDILFLFLCEALIVGLLGVLLGYYLQLGMIHIVDPIIRNTIPGVSSVASMFESSNAFNGTVALVGVLVALLAGLVPAFSATLIRPSEVLKV